MGEDRAKTTLIGSREESPNCMPQKPEHALCHPDRPHYAKGLCRQCNDSIRNGGEPARDKVMLNIRDHYNGSEALKEEFLRDAKAIVNSIKKYSKPPERERRYVETRKPKVADFVASVAIKNQLDMQKTAEELKPELQPYEQAELAQSLDADPNIKQAVEKQLEKRGLDDKSKDRFVELLWQAAESTDPRKEREKLAAWKLLGKALIPNLEQLEVTAPTELKIRGLEAGIARMTSAEADEAQSEANPFAESVSRRSTMDSDE